MTKKLSFLVILAGSGMRRIRTALRQTRRKDGPTCFGGCGRGGSGPIGVDTALAPHRHEPPRRKNPACARIGRLVALQRAAPNLRAGYPKPHLATGQRQGHPDRVGPLRDEVPPPQNSEPPKKNSEPRKKFSEPPSFFSEPRKIFSEPRSLGRPFSPLYRNASEYAFCRTPFSYARAWILAVEQRNLLHGNAYARHSTPYVSARQGAFLDEHDAKHHAATAQAAEWCGLLHGNTSIRHSSSALRISAARASLDEHDAKHHAATVLATG